MDALEGGLPLPSLGRFLRMQMLASHVFPPGHHVHGARAQQHLVTILGNPPPLAETCYWILARTCRRC